VIGILKSKQIAIGLPPDNAEATDARKVLAETIGYLTNNQSPNELSAISGERFTDNQLPD